MIFMEVPLSSRMGFFLLLLHGAATCFHVQRELLKASLAVLQFYSCSYFSSLDAVVLHFGSFFFFGCVYYF